MNYEWQHQASLCKKLRKNGDDEFLKRKCTGKVRHASLQAAENEALRMTSRYNMSKVFQAYECDFCGFHHIGRKFED